MDKYISLDAAIEAVWRSQWMTDFEKGVVQKMLHKVPAVEMGWIPVTERLPENYVILDYDNDPLWLEFVVMIDGAEISTSLCFDGKNFFDGMDGQIYCVTHWMPRPEPPGKDGA